MLPLLLTLCLSASAATAGLDQAPVQQEQYIRLSEEMSKLGDRRAWAGVERTWKAMEALGIEPSPEELRTAAMAARALGDLDSAYTRMLLVAHDAPTKDIIAFLWDVDTRTAPAHLMAAPGTRLVAQTPPLDPVHRATIDRAARLLANTGEFRGRLPAGAYTIADQTLVLTPGAPQVHTLDLRNEGRR